MSKRKKWAKNVVFPKVRKAAQKMGWIDTMSREQEFYPILRNEQYEVEIQKTKRGNRYRVYIFGGQWGGKMTLDSQADIILVLELLTKLTRLEGDNYDIQM